MSKLKYLKILIFLTFFLIVWGAVVRGTDSGLGCPDWPLCHGKLIPPFEKAVMIEYFHRLLASLVGLLTLGFCVAVWKNPASRQKVGSFAVLAFFLLIVQIILGGMTVESDLNPLLIASHLSIAILFLTSLFLIFLRLSDSQNSTRRSSGYYFFFLALVLLLIQLGLGGLVAAMNAGLACPDFPTCQGLWWPPLQGLVALHFVHRLGAVLVFFWIGLLTVTYRQLSSMRYVAGLLVFQILLGIGNVLMGLPLWMRIAHLGVGVLLYLTLLRTTYGLCRLTK